MLRSLTLPDHWVVSSTHRSLRHLSLPLDLPLHFRLKLIKRRILGRHLVDARRRTGLQGSGLKIRCPFWGRVGSNPTPGTNFVCRIGSEWQLSPSWVLAFKPI